MKTIYSILFIFVFCTFTQAQTEFEKAMQKNLQAMDTSKSDQQMKNLAAKFERIAVAEPTQWLPRYYAALEYIIISLQTNDVTVKQSYIDYAQKQLDEALKIAPQESEIFTLQGMVYQTIITLDPMRNGQMYSGKAAGSFQQALQINPANPRPVYLQAVSIMYTPEEYGGGKKLAYPIFVKAAEMFTTFKPVSTIYPNWGKEDCGNYLEMCK